MSKPAIEITEVDFDNAQHCEDLAKQLITYSSDPMGGGKALSMEQAELSIQLLKSKPYAFSFLAYDKTANIAVGLANCQEGVSTFSGKCLANIHDLAVAPAYRSKGIAKQLLQSVESYAKRHDYVKITLEVLSGNKAAQQAYINFGFEGYELSPETGHALFWQKAINNEHPNL